MKRRSGGHHSGYNFRHVQPRNATPRNSLCLQTSWQARAVRKLSKDNSNISGKTFRLCTRMPAPRFVISRMLHEDTPSFWSRNISAPLVILVRAIERRSNKFVSSTIMITAGSSDAQDPVVQRLANCPNRCNKGCMLSLISLHRVNCGTDTNKKLPERRLFIQI